MERLSGGPCVLLDRPTQFKFAYMISHAPVCHLQVMIQDHSSFDCHTVNDTQEIVGFTSRFLTAACDSILSEPLIIPRNMIFQD